VDVPYAEYLGYVGVVHIALGLLALMLARGRAAVFGGLVCGVGVFLALGENNGFYGLVFSNVPGFDTFRVPSRWLLLWQFGGALLAAAGADWIGRGARVVLRCRGLWPRLVLVALILATGLAWQRDEGEPLAQRRTVIVWGGLGAAALLAGALPHLRRPGLGLLMLVGLAGGEVWAASSASPARQAPPPVFSAGETADWLRDNAAAGLASDRLLSLARPEYVPAAEDRLRASVGSLPEPVVESLIVAQNWHDTLTPNVPLQYGLLSADGYDGGVLPLERWLSLSRLLVAAPRPDGVLLSRLERVPDDRLLDLLGIRYVVGNRQTPGRPGLDVVELGDLRLFERSARVPRSMLVFSASPVVDDATALARLSDGSFDPNREVLLAGPASGLSSSLLGQPIEPDTQTPGHWRAHVNVPASGYLLQRESWYPGWRARVDGDEVPVERADVLFRAVPLSPGEHDVEVYFESDSFRRGALVSLLGLLATTALLVAVPIIGAVGAQGSTRHPAVDQSQPGPAAVGSPGD
jgi:hypothetical protein